MEHATYIENWQKARAKAVESSLQIVEIGWEQHVIIDEKAGIVYRYPRHFAAASKLEDEVAVLKDINKLEWPINLPFMLEHNKVFTSYQYISGDVLTDEMVDTLQQEEFEQIGQDLGNFLALFHKLDFAIVEQKQTKHSTSLYEYYANRINSAQPGGNKTAAKKILNELEQHTGKLKNVVLHGDLHGPNVVIDSNSKKLTGVIDLSEMEIGDPHTEFRKIFMTFPKALDMAIKAYASQEGQALNKQAIILWAYANEWANLCYFADNPTNLTFRRAVQNLKSWNQL